jgi:hypothetical protein
MSNVAKGQVEKYFVDGPRKGAKGEFYIHSIYIGGDKYSSFGNKNVPIANQGDTVEFTWEPNGNYKNFDGKSFRVVERGSSPQTSKGGPTSTNASIGRQNALRHATAMVIAFSDSGAYTSPEQMAIEAVQICNDILYPYIESGAVPGEAAETRSPSQPNDDVPF